MAKRILSIIICMVIGTFMAGCSGFPSGRQAIRIGDLIQNQERINSLQQAGLGIAESKGSNSADYRIDTVTPAISSIKDSNQTIYVYVFDNIAERIKVVWEGGNLTKYSPPAFVTVPEGYLPTTYTVRNVLMVDLLDVRNESSIPTGEEQVLRTIGNIVNSLNNSQTMVRAAQSQYWDAQYLVEYYQHWYKDAVGGAHADQYSAGKWSVKYIG